MYACNCVFKFDATVSAVQIGEKGGLVYNRERVQDTEGESAGRELLRCVFFMARSNE